MKNNIIYKSVFVAAFILMIAFSAQAVMQSQLFLIDNFNDGNFAKNPEWWTFGQVSLSMKDGKLQAEGSTTNWYVGGVGTYLASKEVDYSKAKTLEMDVTGNGPNSGTIKIELYDDDNGNWQVEQDSKNFRPVYDDIFVYKLKVDWSGSKHVSIPLADFKDSNPAVGDDIWNPEKSNSSGGLLQMQIIIVAPNKTGKAKISIDNVGFKLSE